MGGGRVKQAVGTAVTNYLWDEASTYGDVVLETDGSGATQASYVLGQGQLLAQTRSGTTSYYLDDGQGNVRDLTNASGAITDQYTYDAYGNAQSSQGTTTNTYRYTGQQFDSLTGLYSLRARYYDPASGRLLSRDTAGLDFSNPVELNRYGYTHDDPIDFADPSGHGAAVDYALLTRYVLVAAAVLLAAAAAKEFARDPSALRKAIAALLALLAALLARLLQKGISIPIPRSETNSETPTPSSTCPDHSPYGQGNYDKLPGSHGLVRGPDTDGGSQICHVNAEVGYIGQSEEDRDLENLHIHYIGSEEFT